MKRYLIFVIALAAAALFVRLGVWQLQRLGERRALNAEISARLAAPPIDLSALRGAADLPDSFRFRAAVARGTFDFTREIVLTGRGYRGTPGVYLVTPLRLADDEAVLVERGWVFSPDGRTVEDPGALREPDTTEVRGVLLAPGTVRGTQPSDTTWPRYLRVIELQRLAPHYPYRLLPLVLRRTVGGSYLPDGMHPAPRPEINSGPHLSYAIQWFAFAVIAVVGSVLLYHRSRGGDAAVRAPEEER